MPANRTILIPQNESLLAVSQIIRCRFTSLPSGISDPKSTYPNNRSKEKLRTGELRKTMVS